MATAIISGGRAFRTATPVFSIPQWSLFVGGAFAPNRRPEGNGGHWKGGAFHPEPLPLDLAMVAAEAAPTRGLTSVFSIPQDRFTQREIWDCETSYFLAAST
jgi:hypothetical protein